MCSTDLSFDLTHIVSAINVCFSRYEPFTDMLNARFIISRCVWHSLECKTTDECSAERRDGSVRAVYRTERAVYRCDHGCGRRKPGKTEHNSIIYRFVRYVENENVDRQIPFIDGQWFVQEMHVLRRAVGVENSVTGETAMFTSYL